MKQTFKLIIVAIFAGVFTLTGYKYFIETKDVMLAFKQESPVLFTASNSNPVNTTNNLDFTEAAEKTVHAVVHVKNTISSKTLNSDKKFFFKGLEPKERIGAGSGVIISADGYIVTNNHVIENSSKLEEFGLPKVSTNSFSDETVVISSIGPFSAVITIPPLVVETAGITFVRSFSVTRTPGDT